MTKTALLLIDLQKEVLDPKGTLNEDLPKFLPRLLEATRELVSWARQRQLPVIWVRMAFRPGYVDASRSIRGSPMARTGLLLEGSWGAEIVDDVGRQDSDIVITKKRTSAFFRTDLDFVLRGLAVDRLVIGGTSTHWAVESTVRDAEALDYEVVVASDATGSRQAEFHESSLRCISRRFGKVMPAREAMELSL
jgi:biuret amidohydrolase